MEKKKISRILWPKLNRYTSLPVLIDTLTKQRITLLSPQSWEDKNDFFYIQKYKEKKGLQTVLALCFTTTSERFHHWKLFAGSSAGVCIEFNRRKLLAAFTEEGIRFSDVSYAYIDDLEADPPMLDNWPFLKRKPFKDEREFRVLYEHRYDCCETKEIPFNLGSINKITLSPWLPKECSGSVITLINSIKDCEKIEINRSTVLENNRWRKVVSRGCA